MVSTDWGPIWTYSHIWPLTPAGKHIPASTYHDAMQYITYSYTWDFRRKNRFRIGSKQESPASDIIWNPEQDYIRYQWWINIKPAAALPEVYYSLRGRYLIQWTASAERGFAVRLGCFRGHPSHIGIWGGIPGNIIWSRVWSREMLSVTFQLYPIPLMNKYGPWGFLWDSALFTEEGLLCTNHDSGSSCWQKTKTIAVLLYIYISNTGHHIVSLTTAIAMWCFYFILFYFLSFWSFNAESNLFPLLHIPT